MSLPLLHAGRTNPGLSAALDLRFALDKSLTAYRGPTPSFSRASTGTLFNSSGVLSYAAINAPRFDHTFNGTSWVSKGLLVEEQRTNLWLQSNSLNTSPWTQYQNTSTENAANSPDGTSNASSVVPNTSNLAHYTYQLVTTSAISYSISFYAKKNGYDFVQLSTGVSADYVNFNLNTGSVGNKSGGIYSSAKIESVGNGWYRCSVTIASIAGSYDHGITVINADTASRRPAFAGDGTSGILLYGFQMEAGSFATSLMPTTTASVTRSADVCQITGGDFSGFWNGTEGSFAVEYDSASPQGWTGAYPVVTFSDSATNNRRIWYSGEGALGGNRFYVNDPASGLSTTLIATPISGGSVSTKASCAFKQNDIAFSYNGGTPYTGASQLTPSGIDILRIGQNPASGNQFCGHIARLRYFNKRLPNATLQLLSEPDPTLNLQFALNKTLTPVAGPAPSFSRASTGTFFNASGVLTSASINTPRFDHVFSGGQWVSRGLLLEEQRTNLLQYSDQFNTSPWTALNASVSANSITSPDGNTTADKLVESATGPHGHEVYYLFTASTTTYTISVFAKAGERSSLYISLGSTINNGVYFNLLNGTVGTATGGLTGQIQDVGNGWFRCSVTGALSAGSNYIQIALSNGITYDYIGNGTSGIYLFGGQLEVGSFSTSYIGTTSGSTTRSADVCQITGTSFNWMWNQGEGSVVAEFDRSMAGSVTSDSMIYIAAGTGAPSNIQNGAYITSGNITTYGYDSAFTYNFNHGSQLANTVYKVSTAIKLNDFASSLNGLAVLTDNSGTVGTNERLLIGHLDWSGGNRLNGHIAKLIYYPARLTNTKLQQLST